MVTYLWATTLDAWFCTLKKITKEMKLWFFLSLGNSTEISRFSPSKCTPAYEWMLVCLLGICVGICFKKCSCKWFFFQKASEQNNQKIVFAKIYVANGSNKAVTDHITNELKGAGVFVEEMIWCLKHVFKLTLGRENGSVAMSW